MNTVILIGRLTKDPEVKNTSNGKSVCSFTIAVDRKFKSKDGEKQADFISCVAWEQRADLLGKYFDKGSRIGILGNIQTRDYKDKDDKKVYVTEVIVDQIEFIDSKSEREEPQAKKPIYDDSPEFALPFDL